MDLARLAGLHPSGVICEIMKDDGTMARVPDLVPFCRQHGLPLVTVAALVAYRLRQEPLVKPLEIRTMASIWGELKVHRFRSLLDGGSHLRLRPGRSGRREPPLVRVHEETLPE